VREEFEMSTLANRLKNIGPGALVAAAFIGPGTVTTCTVSGASVGYTMLWALLFATFATIIFQEMAARIGISTQKGLGENIRDRISNKTLRIIAIAIVIIAIFIGNIAYETGNITGGILGIQAISPSIPMAAIVIIVGLLAALLLFIGKYDVIEKVLTAIVVFMGVVFLATAIASNPDWMAVLAGLFTPQLPSNSSTGLMTAIGLVGTTIVPYNLFLHASSAAERWKDPEQIGDARFDAILSISLGGVISMAILICAAANLNPLWTSWDVNGTTVSGIITASGEQVASAKINGQVMAVALQPLLGDWSTWMIGLGLLAAGFTSAITAPLAAAYAVNGVLGLKKGLKDNAFKAIWAVVLVLGCIMAIMLGKSPTQLILVAQAANAILLPIMAFFVMYCANGKDLKNLKNHTFSNICGVVIIVITLFICYRNMTNFITQLMQLLS
jgi:NRAMP (natural resistance-associated macrophage protein)-like metal ion transporter